MYNIFELFVQYLNCKLLQFKITSTEVLINNKPNILYNNIQLLYNVCFILV